MQKLIAITQLSVDGVMQGPGGPQGGSKERVQQRRLGQTVR
jgi:hypothetical protein